MSYRKALYLSFILSGLFLCCPSGNSRNSVCEKGVSLSLAQQRKAMLSDVRYKLSFVIPEKKEAPVRGEETISFTKKAHTGEVVLDFKAESTQLMQVAVNGKVASYSFRDEHIILSAPLFRTGTNLVRLLFVSGDKPLNRNSDYLYTLFVPDHARQAFPCFDQPDLKARFSLSLEIPSSWKAVANGKEKHVTQSGNRTTVSFCETEQIPTYLFSFVTGKFEKKSCMRNGRPLNAYYRETDSAKVAQLPVLFDEVAMSIQWLEKYTGIAYPFSKYDFIILPGFQFGGMEHVGAVLYNDKRMFLSQHPTPDEELNRMELIAHETSHSWFGDMVTMKWFNDVWTKEVFANYMAAKISELHFPHINHRLNFLKSYQIYALADDRTAGTHPIQQALNNLQDAGLLYGNIIYEKAPVMMRKLEEQMGSTAFQHGLQKYLRQYAFSNADWDDLIHILDKENPQAKLKSFSDVWVKQKGMPDITTHIGNGKLIVTQTNPYHRGCLWQQRFQMALASHDSVCQIIDVNMQQQSVSIPIRTSYETLIPNYDGTGYGRFITDMNNTRSLLNEWTKSDDTQREAMLITIYEDFLMHQLSADECAQSMLKGLSIEKNALVASTACNYLSTFCFYQKGEARLQTERAMWQMSLHHEIPSCRQKLTRTLFSLATDTTVIHNLYQLWNDRNEASLNEDDYMSLSYQLALRKPDTWQDILATQRARLSSNDRRREFDYISRGCSPDSTAQSALFHSLLQKENRSIEPWAQQLLALLNSPLREPYSNRYITPALNILQEIQRTGDIFFPRGWCSALLSGHRSAEACNLVKAFLASHPDYPTALKNKLLQAAYYLFNESY